MSGANICAPRHILRLPRHRGWGSVAVVFSMIVYKPLAVDLRWRSCTQTLSLVVSAQVFPASIYLTSNIYPGEVQPACFAVVNECVTDYVRMIAPLAISYLPYYTLIFALFSLNRIWWCQSSELFRLMRGDAPWAWPGRSRRMRMLAVF